MRPGVAPIRMGIAVALSGRYALLGRQVLAGLECFIQDVNAAGGVRASAHAQPRPVELFIRDDRSDAAACAQAVRELIEVEGIDLLLGPYGSGSTLAAAKVAESRGVVLWNHSGSADQIFDAGFRLLVGIISPASSYLASILELVRANDPVARNVALVSAETGFAQDVANGVERWIADAGFNLLVHHRYPSGCSDFRSILNRLRHHRLDCLLGVGRIEDDLQLARDLIATPLRAKSVGLVVAAIDEFRDTLGAAVEDFMAPSQWEPAAAYVPDYGPSTTEFVASYRRSTVQALDYPAAQGYVGGLIAQRCVEMAGSLDQAALREAADQLRCTTFYGPFRIDPGSGRQLGHQMLVTQWQGGQKRIVWPLAVASATAIYPGPWWLAGSSV